MKRFHFTVASRARQLLTVTRIAFLAGMDAAV
jgi:hypothetical protein